MERYIGPRDIDSLDTDKVWVGRQQGRPITNTYRTYEIKTSPQGEKFVTFKKVNGHLSIFDLTESTFHLEHEFDLNEYKNALCNDPAAAYGPRMTRVEERIYDHRYRELDNFLSNRQILKSTTKPLLKSLIEGLSGKWNQLIDRLDRHLNREILATQSPITQRYNTP